MKWTASTEVDTRTKRLILDVQLDEARDEHSYKKQLIHVYTKNKADDGIEALVVAFSCTHPRCSRRCSWHIHSCRSSRASQTSHVTPPLLVLGEAAQEHTQQIAGSRTNEDDWRGSVRLPAVSYHLEQKFDKLRLC